MVRVPEWLSRHKPYGLVVALILAGLVLLFFNRLAFSNLILARGDTFLYFYPYWQVAADALRSGRVPLWNPDIFMGAPFLANSQTGYLYPLNWPAWLLRPAPYAASLSIVLHVTLAGWGAYLAGRRTLALERPAALLGGALFALGGYLTAQVEHINQLQGLAWLPWLFAAVAPLARTAARESADSPDSTDIRTGVKVGRPYLSITLAVGALFALQLLAGHTQTAFISGVALVLWLGTHALSGLSGGRGPVGSRLRVWLGRWLPVAMALAAGIVLAGALAAAQLLPTLELTGLSSRQGGLPLNEVLSFSWHPLHLARALLPAYGQPLFSEYVAFLPLTGLVLAFVGGWAWRRDIAVRAWVVLVVVALVLAFGRFTPIYYLLGNLPGFDLFRVPARWLAPAALGAALLAGRGWQALAGYARTEWPDAATKNAAQRELRRPLLAAAAFLALLVAWGFAAGLLASLVPAGAEAPYELPGGRALLGWLIEAVLLALLLGVLFTAPAGRARHVPFDVAVLALATLWLGSRWLPYNQLTTPQAFFDLRPPVARLVALAECAIPGSCAEPPGRFLSLSDIFFDPGDAAEIASIYAGQLDEAALYDYLVAVKHKEVLSPNLSMVVGLPAIDGFDGGILPLAAYSAVTRLMLPDGATTTDGRLREFLDAPPQARWLSLFNGRYLITDKTGDVWREGVFFDRQHPWQADSGAVAAGEAPAFEATELWLLADNLPPLVEIVTDGGEAWTIAPERLLAPDLYRAVFPDPATAASISLLPCEAGSTGCGAAALTLVDARDGAFQPLAPTPYRLIHSGDVKIYENLAALPRAFKVYDWQWQPDESAAVAAMAAADFDPAVAAVLTGEPGAVSPASGGRGTVSVSRYTPERVVVRVDGDAGLLVLSDAFYPGWEVTIDGRPATIYPANALFRGVFVPEGAHDVVFEFRPGSFRAGAAVSLAAIVVALLAGLWAVRRGGDQ